MFHFGCLFVVRGGRVFFLPTNVLACASTTRLIPTTKNWEYWMCVSLYDLFIYYYIYIKIFLYIFPFSCFFHYCIRLHGPVFCDCYWRRRKLHASCAGEPESLPSMIPTYSPPSPSLLCHQPEIKLSVCTHELTFKRPASMCYVWRIYVNDIYNMKMKFLIGYQDCRGNSWIV